MSPEEIEKKPYQETPPAPKTWPEEMPSSQEQVPNFLAKFGRISRPLFWALIVGVFVLMAFAGFYFYQYFTARDIAFSLNAPANITLGVPFKIEVSLQNNFDNPIKDIKLSMILPEGTTFVGESPDKRVLDKSFGDLDKNSSLQEEIAVVVFGNEQSLKKFELTASYFPPTLGPKVRFEQTKSVEVAVQESGIKLDLIAPQKVLNNENFEIEIHYQNVSDIDFSGVELMLDYPDFFTFKNATTTPSTGNNIWKIGDLPKNGENKTLIITGSVLSSEQSFFEIKGSLSVELSGQKYLINEKVTSLNISPSPLFLGVTLNDKPNYLAFADDDLKYKITYRNDSGVGLNDVVIKAKLTGEMFDFTSLHSPGFFNSKDNTITWNAANSPALRLLAPGAEGFVEFEIYTQKTYPIKRVSDKNFVLKVGAEISSPTVPDYVAADKTIELADLMTKVGGEIIINSFADKSITMPKVNVPAKFTIHWTITNYSTDVKNIEVKAYLQSGAVWTGQIQTNVSSTLNYNDRTQEVTWLIDRITATKGVISKPAEALFQIQITPNVTQINQAIPLVGDVQLKGVDEFTNLNMTDSAGALSGDSTVIP